MYTHTTNKLNYSYSYLLFSIVVTRMVFFAPSLPDLSTDWLDLPQVEISFPRQASKRDIGCAKMRAGECQASHEMYRSLRSLLERKLERRRLRNLGMSRALWCGKEFHWHWSERRLRHGRHEDFTRSARCYYRTHGTLEESFQPVFYSTSHKSRQIKWVLEYSSRLEHYFLFVVLPLLLNHHHHEILSRFGYDSCRRSFQKQQRGSWHDHPGRRVVHSRLSVTL